jgi:hypothetical protein
MDGLVEDELAAGHAGISEVNGAGMNEKWILDSLAKVGVPYDADATLRDAARELYEALALLVAYYHVGEEVSADVVWSKALAALAKARGETQHG